MPVRASGKAIGASVGRMIFAGKSAKGIEHHLSKIGHEKLNAALSKRGVSGVDAKDIAKAMTGESRGRAGWSQGKIKNVVAALQDVGVAHAEKSASHMVLQAAKTVTPPKGEPHLSAGQLKARHKRDTLERRSEAETEEAGDAHMGVLDRARGSMGRANAASGQIQPTGAETEKEGNRGVRDMREQLRQSLDLQPKIRLSKPKATPSNQSSFQA